MALGFNHMGNNEEPRLELCGYIRVGLCACAGCVCVCVRMYLHTPVTPQGTNRPLKAISH